MTETVPLTAKEQEQLDALQARQFALRAEAAAAERAARVQALAPVAAAIGTIDSVTDMIEALQVARGSVDMDTAVRIDRIVVILTNDVLQILRDAA